MLGSVRLFCWQSVRGFAYTLSFSCQESGRLPFSASSEPLTGLQDCHTVLKSSARRSFRVSVPRARTYQSRASVRFGEKDGSVLFLLFFVSMPRSTRPSLQLPVPSITSFLFGGTFLSLGITQLVADRISLCGFLCPHLHCP